MKTKTQQLQMVNKAWEELQVLNNIRMTPYATLYLEMSKVEERMHRKGKPEHIKSGLTVTQAAKLMCVQQIARACVNCKLTVKDYLFVRKSHFYAHSLVLNYRAEIKEALSDFDLQELAALDYADLIKP